MISINSSAIQSMLQTIIQSHTKSFNTSLERLITGFKVNSPTDDPAGFCVLNKFLTQIRGLETVNKNIQSATSLISTADNSLEEINDIMSKIRELVAQSCNESLTAEERDANQKKVDLLFKQAQDIKESTKYNNANLFANAQQLDKNTFYTDNKATSNVTLANFTQRGASINESIVQETSGIANEAQTPLLASNTAPPPRQATKHQTAA